MSALLLKSPGAVTDPSGLPSVPDLNVGLQFDFNADSLSALAEGAAVSSWTSSRGALAGLALSGTSAAIGAAASLPNHKTVALTSANFATPTNSLTFLPPVTYAMLVRVRELTGSTQVLLIGNSTGGYHRCYLDAAVTTAAISGSASTELAGLPFPGVGVWVPLFLVFNGATSKLSTGKATVTGTTTSPTQTRLRLGSNSSASTTFAHADYHRVIGYNRALSDDEITALRFSMLDTAGLPTA